jgi:putative tryptophan/tyrosine transport system substrate-binding protein
MEDAARGFGDRNQRLSLWAGRVGALGGAYLLDGRLTDATRIAQEGLAAARQREEREVEGRPDRLDAENGETHYRQALALAQPRGMRPLGAHCHLGLGKLYRRTGTREQAQECQPSGRSRLVDLRPYPPHHRGMDRRRFLLTSVVGALAAPLVARAQPAKMPTIGFLGPNTLSLDSHRIGAFVQRLRELGWIEGRNVAIEYRWGEGRIERLAEIAAEFVRLKVDVIVTSGTQQVVAAKQATSVIPIVFAAAGDPVGTGLVASLARPGGNVTGLSLLGTDLAAKRLELLREVVPGLRRLAIMANSAQRAPAVEMREVQATARTLGLEVVTSELRRPEDIAPAFEALTGRAEALYVCNDPLVTTNRISINTLALGVRLPGMYNVREFVDAGGLMSYGPNFLDLYRRTADLVDKILRGAKPADIPVEQPTRFELVINLRTAKALGLTISPALLLRADQVIE